MNDTLTLTDVQASQAGSYSVVVSNNLAVAASQPAVLIVNTNKVLLAGLWRFNEGTGTNVTDSSGLSNNGVLIGENGNVPAWVAGQPGFGGALRFTNDGVNHAYADIPGSGSLMIGQTATNPWTITAWAYEDSGGTSGFLWPPTAGCWSWMMDRLSSWESGASGDAQLYTWSRASTAWQFGWTAGSPVAPLLDQWVHWAVVYDGTNLAIYRNGNQGTNGGTASNPVTAALGYAGYTGAVRIGSELGQPASRNWNGMLDDVAVFNTALTQTEINTVKSGDFTAFITRVAISVNLTPGKAVLSWTALLPGLKLQSSPSLSAAQWNDVSGAPTQQGPVLSISVPTATGAQFFRLRAP